MVSLTMLNAITQQRITSDIVQNFIRKYGFSKNSKKHKKERLSVLKINMQMQNLDFENYFTNKKEKVVLYIMQCLHHCGVTKIKATTIAKKVGCSISTVYNTIKILKQTKQVFVGQVGGKGHYLFIDKLNDNYELAMIQIFGLSIEEANLMREDLLIGDIDCYNLDEESRLKALLKEIKKNQDKSFLTDKQVKEIEDKYLSESSEKGENEQSISSVAMAIEQDVKDHYKKILTSWTLNKEIHTFYDTCQKYSRYDQVFRPIECLYILLNECKYRFPSKQETLLAIQSYINLTQLFSSVSNSNKFNDIFRKVLIRSFEIEGIYTRSYTASRTYNKRKKKLNSQVNFHNWLSTTTPTARNYFNEENLMVDSYYEKVNKKPMLSDVIGLGVFKKGNLNVM